MNRPRVAGRNEPRFDSPVIPITPERKAMVVREYKEKMAAIPCKHFKNGTGRCPFGALCLYSHRIATASPFSAGVTAAVEGVAAAADVRTLLAEEGIAHSKPTTLADFIVVKAPQGKKRRQKKKR